MDVARTSTQPWALQQQYDSIRATDNYSNTVKDAKNWLSENPVAKPLLGGKPTLPVTQYSGDFSALIGGAPISAARAYSDGGTVAEKPADIGRYWNEAALSVRNFSARAALAYVAPDNSEMLQTWRSEAASTLRDFANANPTAYAEKAQQLGIGISGPAYSQHFYTISDDSTRGEEADLSAGKPKSDAERIFFALASPEQIAAFQQKMQGRQDEIDAVYDEAANVIAGNLQRIKDGNAAITEVRGALADMGVDNITLAQLQFRQDGNGGIAVGGHPEAQAIGDAINANPELSQLMSYVFGLAGQGTAA